MSRIDPLECRRRVTGSAKRIVVKVGSRLLTDMGRISKQQRIEQLVAEIDFLRQQGVEVLLVTSGAIGAGMRLAGLDKRPTDLANLQAMAAIGQSRLMSLYEQACASHGFHCGQLLLSADDVRDRKRHLNIRNCISALLARQVLPIINENDTVSVDGICFGDNDRLAALLGSMVRADLTVLLTTVDGLHRRDGNTMVERISVVTAINDSIRGMAGGTDGNQFSKGGMGSKIDAAEITVTSGESMWIADGRDFGVLRRIMAGEDIGTLFLPSSTGRLTGSKRYLAFFSDPAGRVVVDHGAEVALRKNGKSLLPSGILRVEDDFEKGDTVHIVTVEGDIVGMGVTNYASAILDRIKGLKSSEIAAALNREGYTEAIHRDNLVILDS